MEAAPEIAFFQAVKARLNKFDSTGGSGIIGDDGMEVRVKQTIDQALVTDTVVDVFDAAGIKNLIYRSFRMTF